jgi:two-component system OmpR family sensor kinase
MSDPVWYRSLYWRIAFGFIAMLAILLLAQGLLFLWLTDRIFGTPARTPAQLAALVAEDVAAELQQRPDGDFEAFVRDHFSRVYQPFLVVLSDGRRASNRPTGLPPEFGRVVAGRMRGEPLSGGRFGEAGLPPHSPVTPGGDEAGRGAPPSEPGGNARGLQGRPPIEPRMGPGGPGGSPGRRGGPRFPIDYAPIVVNDRQVGVVAVPSNPPPVSVALRELGPTLTWFGLGLLGVGATLTALFVFRPAHKRLRTLEQAARALGEGRTDVRATEAGGDEVSSLARTFNRMAIDLDSRATALAASDRARRQLLADVSHELMTPLSAIRGYVETLGMADVPLDQNTRSRYLEIVEQETHKLEAIIGDLLDLARLEGGGDRLRAEPVAVEDLFKRVADRHQPVLRDRSITLDFDIAQGTPRIRGDAARLEQALQNVAANAIRHTPSGGCVRLAATAASDDAVVITVRDTGPGIPTDHLPRVFDRFYKVDAARAGTAVPSGSGLGLSIVRAIIERHGGSVSAGNAPEGGAVFELRLPAA